MTEQEVLLRAKAYIDKLATGLDPISGDPAPEDDVINNIKVARCLFYVSGVLQKVIEGSTAINNQNAGIQGAGLRSKVKKEKFSITQEEIDNYEYSAKPIPVSEIVRRSNACNEREDMTKLSHKVIVSYLLDEGILEMRENLSGNSYKAPTEIGEALGIHQERRTSLNGDYFVTIYDEKGQKFVIDNLFTILEWGKHIKAKENIDIVKETE